MGEADPPADANPRLVTAAEHLAPITRLGRKVREVGESVGAELEGFGVSPDLDGDGPAHAHLLFVIGDPPAKPAVSDADQAVLDGTLRATSERSAADQRAAFEELARRLNDDPEGGIL